MSTITIALDAGHGGSDPGAVYGSRREKDDTLRLTRAIGDILERNGINVYYVRTDDEYQTPFQKATAGNNSGADYFVSIHRNSSENNNQYSGVETLVYNDNGIKAIMARNINEQLEKAGFNNLGVTERPNLVVLKRTKMPAVLVEVGFINTDADNALLDSRFYEVAQAIADGILQTVRSGTSKTSAEDDTMESLDTVCDENGNCSPEIFADQQTSADDAYFYNERNDINRDDSMNRRDDLDRQNDTDRRDDMNWRGDMDRRGDMNRQDDMNWRGDMEQRSDMNRQNDMDQRDDMDRQNNMDRRDDMDRQNNMDRRDDMDRQNNMDRRDDMGWRGDIEQRGNIDQRGGMEQRGDMNRRGSMNNMNPGSINRNIQFDQYEYEEVPDKLYRVQVGAYKNKENADRALNSLLIEGFPAFMIYDDGYYKVQVGAFQYLSNAIKMERRLRRFRYNTYIVYN